MGAISGHVQRGSGEILVAVVVLSASFGLVPLALGGSTSQSAASPIAGGVPAAIDSSQGQPASSHILEAAVGESEAVLYRSTALMTPVYHRGNTHDSRERLGASFNSVRSTPEVRLTALNKRLLGTLELAVGATDMTIAVPSVDSLRVGESLEFGFRSEGSELMRIADVDAVNGTVTVTTRHEAHGDWYVAPRAWPIDTPVYHHRRAQPEPLPGYMAASGVQPIFETFRFVWEGVDVPYLAMNLAFPGGDSELENWEDLLVYVRLRRADGAGSTVEGIVPMATDGVVPYGHRQPGDPYTLRERRLRRYLGWPDGGLSPAKPAGNAYVSIVDDETRASKFVTGPEPTFFKEMVDWIFANDGHDLGRIYPDDDRYNAEELEALQRGAALASQELVHSYQVAVDIAILNGTDPRIDSERFWILPWNLAGIVDLGVIDDVTTHTALSGTVKRDGDEVDHFAFTLEQQRVVHLELTALDRAASLALKDSSGVLLGQSDAPGTGDESILMTLDPGHYRIVVRAEIGGEITYQLGYRVETIRSTVWLATMTVGADDLMWPPVLGYSRWGRNDGQLSTDRFTIGEADNRVHFLIHFADGLHLGLNRHIDTDFTIRLGDSEFAARDSRVFKSAARAGYWWNGSGLELKRGATVEIVLETDQATLPQRQPAPPSAFFLGVPERHDGVQPFKFRLHFTEQFPLSFKTLKDHSLHVSGGTLQRTARATKGSNKIWEIIIKPTSANDVIITLANGADCEAADAICTADGRQLHNQPTLTIPGP